MIFKKTSLKSRKSYIKKQTVAGLLLMAALLFLYPQAVSAITLSSITSDSIRQKESQINSAQTEKKQLQSNLTDVKNLKKQLEKDRADLQSYVRSLDASLADIQTRISELNGLIATKEGEIAETEEELAVAIDVQDSQYAAMKARIRSTYESGGSTLIENLSGAKSFGDFLNRLDYAQKVVDYDDRKLQEYTLVREYVEACKEQLEAEKELLDEAKAEVEVEEAAMEELISAKNQEISAKESDISNKAAAIAEYEAEINAQNELIQQLELAVVEERKRLAAANGYKLTYDGGVFAMPAPSYTRVSDDYGYRIHPTLKVEQFHNGVDFAAPNGSPVKAGYDGQVVAASYSATMGNYIMIDHGDNLYTIYMHCSALYVAKGDLVVKGQQIAAVGSTGRSTGPHLHFSVRKNGSYVSPWNYLG